MNMKKVLITGASSGIGRDMAVILSKMGFNLILVARRSKKLEELKSRLKTDVKIICMDISKPKSCIELYESVKNEDIDILINNAGFGIFGKFTETDIQKELNMIDLNIKAVHILTKLFLKDFKAKNSGYILNVASSAAFLPGPLLSSYYASKAYVLRLTEAIYEELRMENSKVYIGTLCPGPVNTEFNNRAGVKFSIKGMSSKLVAKYAIRKMFERKLIIIPGILMKAVFVMERLIPIKILLKICYHFQKRKQL